MTVILFLELDGIVILSGIMSVYMRPQNRLKQKPRVRYCWVIFGFDDVNNIKSDLIYVAICWLIVKQVRSSVRVSSDME
jgi:hypothetical protein